MGNSLVQQQIVNIPRKGFAANRINELQHALTNRIDPTIARLLGKIFEQQAQDESVNYNYIENNLPHGYITHAEVVAPQGTITAIADLTNMVVSWKSIMGRKYRIYGVFEVYTSNASGVIILTLTDDANAPIQRATSPLLSTSAFPLPLNWIEDGIGEVVTRKLRLQKSGGSGNVTLSADPTFPALLIVEDIGPVNRTT